MASSSQFQTVVTPLCRATAMDKTTATFVGDWHRVESARDLDFFIRFTSAGSPNLAVSVDLSPFPVFVTDKNAIPPSGGAQPTPPWLPDANYFTVSINATVTAKWNGTDANGGWIELGPVAGIVSHYSALRYRIVVTTADATSVDFVMTRAAQ